MASKTKSRSGRRGSSRSGSRSSASRKAGSRNTGSRNARSDNAVAMLKEDHARVKALFQRFEKTRGEEQKSKLAETICTELKIHAQLEEEIFYPAAREALEDEEILDEAQVEHESAKQLIAQIEAADPSDQMFDAKVKVLGEYILHHVREEEGEMFREIRDTQLDLASLGEQMKQRKQQLQSRGSGGLGKRLTGDTATASA
jgi:hemerythrin superfamily protein